MTTIKPENGDKFRGKEQQKYIKTRYFDMKDVGSIHANLLLHPKTRMLTTYTIKLQQTYSKGKGKGRAKVKGKGTGERGKRKEP